ncbi:hypothetical protein HOV93_42350 [Planctomycetes bacterium FF15]|uniref:Secreted protein n=1 Tax=Bremerella alba TaxID=980252 RepID=A0A7V8V9D4_9BACT|nr:hypothetical protein [Bremerella alba]
MPRRATAMMAVLAVFIHCVLGCCARCLTASEHHTPAEHCQANCICCDHHQHDAYVELCLQPAVSLTIAEPSSDADPQQHHECLCCGMAKCAFILNESPSDGLINALLLPADTFWSEISYLPIESVSQNSPRELCHRTSSHATPKVRLHLSLAVLTL